MRALFIRLEWVQVMLVRVTYNNQLLKKPNESHAIFQIKALLKEFDCC
jgi:hypothetical protein